MGDIKWGDYCTLHEEKHYFSVYNSNMVICIFVQQNHVDTKTFVFY